jgi:SAM-dependent methyltransferase
MNPACPVTGKPAARYVQTVTTDLLANLWLYNPLFRVDARPSFGTTKQLDLWESPTGMYFFEPRPEGDHEFYTTFYKHTRRQAGWKPKGKGWRAEFDIAAGYVSPGDHVLDVGCGFAGFREVIPHADYTGLDPNFADQDPLGKVRNETLESHLMGRAGTYDLVCAFQVLEHLADPLSFFKGLVRAAKPGGLVVIGVPQVPSAMTRIPNCLVNAPPHHLTWWTKSALAELAHHGRVKPELIEHMPWSRYDSLGYWLERCSPIKCRDQHFKGDWWWHAATVVSWLGGLLANVVMPLPRSNPNDCANLLMAARVSE